MRLIVDRDDLTPENEDTHLHDITFHHFKEPVKEAILVVGCAKFQIYVGSTTYKEIYPVQAASEAA